MKNNNPGYLPAPQMKVSDLEIIQDRIVELLSRPKPINNDPVYGFERFVLNDYHMRKINSQVQINGEDIAYLFVPYTVKENISRHELTLSVLTPDEIEARSQTFKSKIK